MDLSRCAPLDSPQERGRVAATFIPDSNEAKQVRFTLAIATDRGFVASGNQKHSERDYSIGGFTLFSRNGIDWSPARSDGQPFAFPRRDSETALRYGTAAGGGAVISGITRQANFCRPPPRFRSLRMDRPGSRSRASSSRVTSRDRSRVPTTARSCSGIRPEATGHRRSRRSGEAVASGLGFTGGKVRF